MVRAILEDRKTQTRRIIPNPVSSPIQAADVLNGWRDRFGNLNAKMRCPYGKPGDRLWVRETFCPVRWGDYMPVAIPKGPEGALIQFRADYKEGSIDYDGCWKPAIHMPRWASRILLEITEVRVQRVQEISEDDAIAEGVEVANPQAKGYYGPRNAFKHLWDSINAKRDKGKYAWKNNPWVWVISFRRINA